jgi:hypothetical protein
MELLQSIGGCLSGRWDFLGGCLSSRWDFQRGTWRLWPFDRAQDMLSPLSSLLAAVSLLLALANGLYFAQYAVSAANTPARRVGAAALTALNAALCCEAALFVVLSLSRAPASALAFLAVILVRASLLAAIGFIFVLTLRARRRSRR